MQLIPRFAGKVCIVTGGAQGIGKVAAQRFAAEGARVIIWDINRLKSELAVTELKEKGLDAVFQEVDTTKYTVVEAAAKELTARLGKIDILINNAGITKDATVLNMTLEQWQQVIDVNLTGVFNCTKAIAPYMVQSGFGRIINTSSLVGLYGNFGQTNYSATKSGIVGITKVWARELSRHGITVNAVVPGFIETDTIRTIPDKIIKSIQEKIPVGRLGKPDDISNAYMFLASEESSYISGAVLSIDGAYVS